MSQVAQRPSSRTQIRPHVYRPYDPQAAKTSTLAAVRNGWPVIAVCGGAMASTAWLPADNPGLGFLVLSAEVVLGALAVARLVATGNR
jgi:hypothetical protein